MIKIKPFIGGGALLCFLAASLPAQAVPLQKTFNAWQVSCNNLNDCEARNTLDHQDLVLKITRAAGKAGKVSVTIDYGRQLTDADKSSPIAGALKIDGRRLTFNPREWEIEPAQIATGNKLVVDDFIRSISDGLKIQLTPRASSSDAQPTIDLRGLKAALLLIDEQQQRLGTRSAWVKKGNKAADSVPDAPAAPRLTSAFTAPAALTENEKSAITQQVATQIDTSDCSLEAADRQLRLYPLTNRQALVLIACERGAYNQYDLAYLLSRSAPFKVEELDLTMPFVLDGNGGAPELINTYFEAATGRFSTYAKGRGIGDCGVASDWQFDGSRFHLVRYAQEDSCDAYSAGGADWPALWVTQL